MSHLDAERWNSRYAEEGEEWLERGPRRLLQEHADLLPGQGLALDAAAGVANMFPHTAHVESIALFERS